MTTTNDVTGDSLVSKPTSDLYRENWDRIFGNKTESKPARKESQEQESR